MLMGMGGGGWGYTVDNWPATPSTTFGTIVTPGASNAEGAWTQVLSALAYDVYCMHVAVRDGAASALVRDQLLDIGVDPSGGTSYTPIIQNASCGQSGTIGNFQAPKEFIFPFYIKAGSTVAVRVQGANSNAGTVRVVIRAFGLPGRPEAYRAGAYSETIGAITNSAGVSFTPGNATAGAWVSLGTTGQALWWWQLGWGVTSTVVTADRTYIELAWGDASNKHIFLKNFHSGSTTEAVWDNSAGNLMPSCFCPVPAGSTIYVRGTSDAAPDTGYHAVAIGIGG